MLKLLDRNLSSTKKGRSYWKYNVYTTVINKHRIIESITKNGCISIKTNDCPVLKIRSDFNNGKI